MRRHGSRRSTSSSACSTRKRSSPKNRISATTSSAASSCRCMDSSRPASSIRALAGAARRHGAQVIEGSRVAPHCGGEWRRHRRNRSRTARRIGSRPRGGELVRAHRDRRSAGASAGASDSRSASSTVVEGADASPRGLERPLLSRPVGRRDAARGRDDGGCGVRRADDGCGRARPARGRVRDRSRRVDGRVRRRARRPAPGQPPTCCRSSGRRGYIPNLMYATAHYRNGILLAPVTAALVADAMLDNRIDPALAAVSPQRFGDLGPVGGVRSGRRTALAGLRP